MYIYKSNINTQCVKFKAYKLCITFSLVLSYTSIVKTKHFLFQHMIPFERATFGLSNEALTGK